MWPDPPAALASQLALMVAQAPGKISLACHHLETGERWSFGHAVMPAASLIKVPLAVAAYQATERGELALLERVSVPPLSGDDEAEFDNLGLAPVGTRSTWRKVIDRMLTESDNAATNALVDRLGLDAIAPLAAQVGLSDTVLARRMLDGEARAAGRENYTSAQDMVALLVALVRGELLTRAHTLELLGVLGQQRDLEKLARGLAADAVFAGKTGELPGYRHDMALIDWVSEAPIGSAGWVVAALGQGEAELSWLLGDVAAVLDAHFAEQQRAFRSTRARLEAERAHLVPDPRLAHDALVLAHRDGAHVLRGKTTVAERLAGFEGINEATLLTGAPGVVGVPCLQLRAGPGHAHELVSQVRLGDPLALLEAGPDWTLLRAPDGYVAYGKTNNITNAPEAAATHVIAAPLATVVSDRGRTLQLSAGSRLTRVAPDAYRLPSGEVVRPAAADVRLLGERGDVTALLAFARRFLGLPYLWGGATGWGIDCSGLVQLCHFVLGVELPRDADQQEQATERVERVDALAPGDLVFFPGHVGLWLGGGELLHASAQAGMVTINSLEPGTAHYEPWLAEHFTGGGRSPLATA